MNAGYPFYKDHQLEWSALSITRSKKERVEGKSEFL